MEKPRKQQPVKCSDGWIGKIESKRKIKDSSVDEGFSYLYVIRFRGGDCLELGEGDFERISSKKFNKLDNTDTSEGELYAQSAESQGAAYEKIKPFIKVRPQLIRRIKYKIEVEYYKAEEQK